MYHIYFNSQDNEEWSRLLPSSDKCVENCKFYFSGDDIENDQIDFLVVFNKVSKTAINLEYNQENSLLIACEPPSVYQYHQDYLNQFKHLIITQNNYFSGKYSSQNIYFPWHIGVNRSAFDKSKNLSYSQLLNLNPSKKKLISVIRTNKELCFEHEIRNKIIDRIIDNFRDQIDVYGRNDNYISDKKDALLDYHYHISIENYFGNDFWTEKLSDPLIAMCNPIYLGCKNLKKYFDTNFYQLSDIDIDYNLKLVEKILENQQPKFEYKIARDLIFKEFNLFIFLVKFVNSFYSKKTLIKKLKTEKKFTNINFYKRKFKEYTR